MDLSRQLDIAFDRFDEGRDIEAIEICEAILARDPCFYGALYLCGSILGAKGCHSQGREYLEKAIAEQPEKPLAHFNLAKILIDAGQAHAALSRIEAYLQLASGDPESLAVKGSALLALGRSMEAQAVFEHAISLDPQNPYSHYNCANALKAQGLMEPALDAFAAAISLNPDVAAFHVNRGIVLHALERFEEALASYDAALKIEPDGVDALSNRGISLHAVERFDEALASYDAAIAREPTHSEARANRAYTSLLLGDFRSGWDDYEWRVKSCDYEGIALGHNRVFLQRAILSPQRDDLAGQHVILFGEQGIGDVIMFSSILEDLLRIASRVDLVVDHRLCALLRGSFPQARLFPIEEYSESNIPAAAVCVMIASLGVVFRKERASFPQAAYLRADPAKVLAWEHRLGVTSTKRIGISWRGGMVHTRRTARSLPLHDFLGLFGRTDFVFVSLQHNATQAEMDWMRDVRGLDVRAFHAEDLHDFSDLAALIGSLDAIVTVQNSNVHLCGALGKPCLAILPAVPEWRYGIKNTRMPWYGSVQLLRRDASGGLSDLPQRLGERLDLLIGPQG